MDDMTYEERCDRLSKIDPSLTSEQEKRELYACMVFNAISTIALARQRGDNANVLGNAKKILDLPYGALELIANSMIEKMQNTTPTVVNLYISDVHRSAFVGTKNEFYNKNPSLRPVLNISFFVLKRRYKQYRNDNLIEVHFRNRVDDDGDYETYVTAIRQHISDIVERNGLTDILIREYEDA